MAIIYVKNKKTGRRYAYESTSVWNPELKQPRAKRKYLGVVDERPVKLFPQAKNEGDSLTRTGKIRMRLMKSRHPAVEEPTSRSLKTCRKS